jgi:hypothetical protein
MLDNALPAAAQDYPLLNLFWTMLLLFAWVFWLVLIVRVTIDIFRNDQMSGWGKAGWLACVLVLPYIGVLLYLIAHGADTVAGEVTDMQTTNGRVRSAPQQPVGAATGNADELSKLAALHDRGVLTDGEYASQKATVLSR